jgi:hypothetical protein
MISIDNCKYYKLIDNNSTQLRVHNNRLDTSGISAHKDSANDLICNQVA